MGLSDYTKYLGPLGYGIDAIQGNAGDPMTYLDPGDLFGKQAAKDVLDAGKEAQAQLQRLSDTAWQRQMQGLQLALGSMNNYNGVLSNLYGVPTNQYDPRGLGGQLGPIGGAGSADPGAGGGAFGPSQRPPFVPGDPTVGAGAWGPSVRPPFVPLAPGINESGVDANGLRGPFTPQVAPSQGPSMEALRGVGHF